MARLRVKELAQQRGFSMNALSHETRLHIITIRNLWRDDPEYDPALSTLQRVADALKVPVQDLFVPQEQ